MLKFDINKHLSNEDIEAEKQTLESEAERYHRFDRSADFFSKTFLAGAIGFIISVIFNKNGHIIWPFWLFVAIAVVSLLSMWISKALQRRVFDGRDEFDFLRYQMQLTTDDKPEELLAIVDSWPAAKAYVDQVKKDGRKIIMFEAKELRKLHKNRLRDQADAALYGNMPC